MPAIAPEDLPEIFTHAEARSLGVSDRTLYRWRVDVGLVEQIARGIFTVPDLIADANLIELAVRSPSATLCLTTALAHHDLSDEIPRRIDAAIPRCSTPTESDLARLVASLRRGDVRRRAGRETLIVHGDLTIGIYSPARSIVDSFDFVDPYGENQAIDAVRRWLAKRGNHPSELLDTARQFPVAEAPLRRVLQALL